MSNNNNDDRHLDAVAATQVLPVLVAANFVERLTTDNLRVAKSIK